MYIHTFVDLLTINVQMYEYTYIDILTLSNVESTIGNSTVDCCEESGRELN